MKARFLRWSQSMRRDGGFALLWRLFFLTFICPAALAVLVAVVVDSWQQTSTNR